MPFPFRFVLLSGALSAPLAIVPVASQGGDLNAPPCCRGHRRGRRPTPMDQGSSPEDVRVTQSLRRR
jgi:hypothetical protein